MNVPSETELERFFGTERAPAVRFVETVASWPSLRVLDHLYAEGPDSTGEIARSLNMDMREVRDRLDALAGQGIVEETDGAWRVSTDEVVIRLGRDDGIAITHSVTTASEPTPGVGEQSAAPMSAPTADDTDAADDTDEPSETDDTDGGEESTTSRLRKLLFPFFR